MLLAGTQVPATPEPLPVYDLVEADLWNQLPTDLSALLAILPQADLYLQDEIQVAFTWCIRLPMIPMPTVSNGTGLVSRRVVTHYHHRSDFALRLELDVETHCRGARTRSRRGASS